MSKGQFFIGAPVNFKPGVDIYPPKIKEVLSNKKYSAYIQVLTYSHEEIEDLYVEEKKDIDVFPSPLEFLLNNCYHSKEYEKLCKEAFYFFLKTKVEFFYEKKLILIGDLEQVLLGLENLDQIITLSEEDFFDFQNLIRQAVGDKTVSPPDPNLHPRIKAMRAKARYRDKIKAKQNAKNGLNLFTIMASICCMGIGITPLNIGEMSYVAINAIVNQYQSKEKYQIDIDSLLAGADSKKIQPKYWIRNLEEE